MQKKDVQQLDNLVFLNAISGFGNKNKLKQMPNAKQANRGKQVQYPLIEKDLIDLVESQRKDGYIITPMNVKLQTIKIPKAAKYDIISTFKFSSG